MADKSLPASIESDRCTGREQIVGSGQAVQRFRRSHGEPVAAILVTCVVVERGVGAQMLAGDCDNVDVFRAHVAAAQKP